MLRLQVEMRAAAASGRRPDFAIQGDDRLAYWVVKVPIWQGRAVITGLTVVNIGRYQLDLRQMVG